MSGEPMTYLLPGKCESCKWFDGWRSEVQSAEDSMGYCHRRAPVRVLNQSKAAFPWVAGDNFCGEYQFEEKTRG